MGILQKKCRTTGKKALAYRGKGGQNTGTAFPALRLGVVPYLLIPSESQRFSTSMTKMQKEKHNVHSNAWVFSVWAFCSHMWALHELHNIPEIQETTSKKSFLE